MSNIFDLIPQHEGLSPTTVEEYVALQLAKRLRDETSLTLYRKYAIRHPVERLIETFHRAQRESDPARAFHLSLAPSET